MYRVTYEGGFRGRRRKEPVEVQLTSLHDGLIVRQPGIFGRGKWEVTIPMEAIGYISLGNYGRLFRVSRNVLEISLRGDGFHDRLKLSGGRRTLESLHDALEEAHDRYRARADAENMTHRVRAAVARALKQEDGEIDLTIDRSGVRFAGTSSGLGKTHAKLQAGDLQAALASDDAQMRTLERLARAVLDEDDDSDVIIRVDLDGSINISIGEP